MHVTTLETQLKEIRAGQFFTYRNPDGIDVLPIRSFYLRTDGKLSASSDEARTASLQQDSKVYRLLTPGLDAEAVEAMTLILCCRPNRTAALNRAIEWVAELNRAHKAAADQKASGQKASS